MTGPEPQTLLALAKDLIGRRSLTPDDAGCQDVLAERLASCDFNVERLPFGDVSNLWATHGHGHPLLVMAGHTDVVPAGPIDQWNTDPFGPVVENDILYGRGAADMKGGLASMVEAAVSFVTDHPHHHGTLALLITSDEEGPAHDGTRYVMEQLEERGTKIDYCVIGEPSSAERIGDEIRVGRRGSLSGHVIIAGVQGHVAYPDHADNAAHRMLAALSELLATQWPSGDPTFPPLSFQIANVSAGLGADNVIPGRATAQFNFRYPAPLEPGDLQEKVDEIFARHSPHHAVTWRDGGRPFLSTCGRLRKAALEVIAAEVGSAPICSTTGGTSDGRYIAPTGAEIVEIGPIRTSIHKANEHVAIADLAALGRIYHALIEQLLRHPHLPHVGHPEHHNAGQT